MPRKRGKKKKPDSHLNDYLEERDVVMEVLKLKKLRKFCKKLHNTSELLEKENFGFQVEKEKLLAYWKILDKQFWQGADERRTLEICEIDKDFRERLKKIEAKDKLIHKLYEVFKNNLNFLKTRSINRMITKRKLDQRFRELSYQIHEKRKEYIMCNCEDFRNEMYQHVVAFKDKYVPLFSKCQTCMDRLQQHYFYERHCLVENARELFTRKGERMLKRKERTTKRAMSELVKSKKQINSHCSQVTRKTSTNVKNYEYKVYKIRRSFFLLNKRKKALKKIFRSYQTPRIEMQMERIKMLNIIRNEKKIEKLARKAEAQNATAIGQLLVALSSYTVADANCSKEQQFENEVRKLSMDEVDQIIINHMAKKMLSFIKLKIIKKKIRINHYILNSILKEDGYVYGLIKDVVTSDNFNLENPIETYQERNAVKSSIVLEREVDDDPFCLNCVEESAIKISGTIPYTSMHQTCKDFIVKHLRIKKVNIESAQPNELIQLMQRNTDNNRNLRFKLEKLFALNKDSVEDVPINIRQSASPKISNYILDWQEAMLKLFKRYLRCLRCYEKEESYEEREIGEEDEEFGATVEESFSGMDLAENSFLDKLP